MAEPPLFPYLTPLIYPLFPVPDGELTVGLNLQTILDDRTLNPFDGVLAAEIGVYRDGQCTQTETKEIGVTNGRCDVAIDWSRYPLGGIGYVEIALSTPEPAFRRIDLPVGYGLMTIPGYGTLTVIPDAKFARPIIIDQMQTVKSFCLARSGCRWDRRSNAGNSIFLPNPYEKDILASIYASTTKSIRRKVPAKQAVMVSLEPILDDGVWTCVMVTGNNRIPAWDVRHAANDPGIINNVDHLDVFRGTPTHREVGAIDYAKHTIRRVLRTFGHVT
jgi:hypothetical protein